MNILYGSASGLSRIGEQIWNWPSSISFFGLTSLAACDYNADGRDDLGIGHPGAQIQTLGVGAVSVLYGSIGGLVVANHQYIHQDYVDGYGEIESNPDLPGTLQDGDHFGSSLTSGDFDADGYSDLASGVPGKDLNNINGTGMAVAMYGSSSGLTAIGSQIWGQNIPLEINGSA